MGSGKSSAAITYMNEHPDNKYIYITPYLDEVARVKSKCKNIGIVEPSNKISEYDFKKIKHTATLIKRGKNIVTTHQAFKNYNDEILKDVQRQGYMLIVDESLEITETFELHTDDLIILKKYGVVEESKDICNILQGIYKGDVFTEIFEFSQVKNLLNIQLEDNEEGDSSKAWMLSPKLFTSFKDIFILTYLFEGQSLARYMKLYNIPYEYIGIKKKEGVYRFSENTEYVPEYTHDLKKLINICSNEKMNDIGRNYYALSKNWFSKNKDGVNQLKNNITNYFHNMYKDIPANRKMWGSFNKARNSLKGKGYTTSFVVFNTKATNEYKGRDCLVYAINVFMNSSEKLFYRGQGVEVDEDLYALSTMIQWIWRSAIRDGNPINIYIPSKRMRTLLVEWIDNVSTNGCYEIKRNKTIAKQI